LNIMADQRFPSHLTGGKSAADDTPRTSDRFERALLDSARSDVAPPRARERAALAFGIGLPAGSSPRGTLPEHRGSTRPEAPLPCNSATASGSSKLALAGKAALVSVAGGVVSLLIVTRSNDLPPLQPVPPPPRATQTARDAPAPLPVAAAAPRDLPAVASPGPSTAAEPSRPPRRRPASTRQAAPARAAAGESRLLAEVARLDQARAALAVSDAPLVLQHVERYSIEFPNGALAREAARLEARAHALEGGSAKRAHDIGKAR
jgi:hypothetical protein